MNFLVVVSLVAAAAHAVPFGSRGLLPSTTTGMMGIDSTITWQRAHDLIEQGQQAKMEQALLGMGQSGKNMGFSGGFGEQSGLVKTMASEITAEAQQAEMAQLLESVNQVKKSPTMFMGAMPVVSSLMEQTAMKEIQKSAIIQENNFMLTDKEMKDTLESAFFAESLIQCPELMRNPAAMKILTQMSKEFCLQVQLLIQENNMEKTMTTMNQQKHQLKQLKAQIKFLKLELLKLKVLDMTMITPAMGSMAKAEGVLVAQLNKLIAEEMALEVVIQQLQRVLVSQQKQLMITEEKEMATLSSPMNMMMMSPMRRMMGF